MYGLVTMKTSKNQSTAFTATRLLLSDNVVTEFSKAFNLPPVRRDLLANRPSDAAQATFYDAAIRSRTWLDPKPDESDKVFQTLVESVSSGRNKVPDSLQEAQARLIELLKPYNGQ
jgi:ABC-type glycerol-3-phosphate transport system substrate-binding protein